MPTSSRRAFEKLMVGLCSVRWTPPARRNSAPRAPVLAHSSELPHLEACAPASWGLLRRCAVRWSSTTGSPTGS